MRREERSERKGKDCCFLCIDNPPWLPTDLSEEPFVMCWFRGGL